MFFSQVGHPNSRNVRKCSHLWEKRKTPVNTCSWFCRLLIAVVSLLTKITLPKACQLDADLFSRVLFSFLPPLLVTPLPLLFSAPFSPFPPLKNALFCRGRGTAQSLERGSFRMDLSTNFGKETPSRNRREKGPGCAEHHLSTKARLLI